MKHSRLTPEFTTKISKCTHIHTHTHTHTYITSQEFRLRLLRQCCFVWSEIIGPHSSGNFNLKWKIIKQCKSYNNFTRKCNSCLFEKFIIICYKDLCNLNKRNESASSCPHRIRYLLKYFMIKQYNLPNYK